MGVLAATGWTARFPSPGTLFLKQQHQCLFEFGRFEQVGASSTLESHFAIAVDQVQTAGHAAVASTTVSSMVSTSMGKPMLNRRPHFCATSARSS